MALILARHLSQQEQVGSRCGDLISPAQSRISANSTAFRFRRVEPVNAHRLESIRRVAWLLRAAQPDVLMPYTWLLNVVCGFVWKWAGAGLCVWNQRDEGLFLPYATWERWAVQRTPRFIANSACRGAVCD